MKHYYLPFEPSADVNYFILFELIEKAEYNVETKAFDTIPYVSIKKLADQLTFSQTTLNRIISNDKNNAYKSFVSADTKKKVITLKNSFSNSNTERQPFIVLTDKEVQLLKQHNDNLFCRYLMYIKYYCGYSKSKKTDFTANQFLTACGYSIKSNSNKENLSLYNERMVKNDLMRIERYTDDLGHLRNRYAYNF